MTGCLGLLGGGKSAPGASGGGGGGFNAATYGTVLAWYDFTDSTKVLDNFGASATNGVAVDKVVDKSSNGFDARQTSSTSRPTVVTALINGLQGLNFDGANDFLQCPSSRSLIKNLSGITIVSVHNVDTLTASNGVFECETGAAKRIRLRHLSTDGQWATEIKAQDAGTDDEFYSGGGAPLAIDTWTISIWVIDFSGNTLKVWSNGTQKGSTVADIHSSGNLSNTDLAEDPVLYAGDVFASLPFDGQAAQFIIYSGAMNDTNRDLLETALGSLFAITVV